MSAVCFSVYHSNVFSLSLSLSLSHFSPSPSHSFYLNIPFLFLCLTLSPLALPLSQSLFIYLSLTNHLSHFGSISSPPLSLFLFSRYVTVEHSFGHLELFFRFISNLDLRYFYFLLTIETFILVFFLSHASKMCHSCTDMCLAINRLLFMLLRSFLLWRTVFTSVDCGRTSCTPQSIECNACWMTSQPVQDWSPHVHLRLCCCTSLSCGSM